MRKGKELLAASKQFTSENRTRSWIETLGTLFLTILFLVITFQDLPVIVRAFTSLVCGLLYVRLFVIYHDFQHRAILKDSAIASVLMNFIGLYLLAPQNVWTRTHEHHHNNNSKLTISGIGSYPTITRARFLGLPKNKQRIYLINRNPLTIICGYFTVFIFWLNLKSVIESRSKHLDSLLALVLHAVGTAAVLYFFGVTTFILAWFIPFFIAFAIGSYLFYCQHNFPTAKFRENEDWNYVQAALSSTSLMKMNPVMHWFTCNIGYHPVHHVNSRIPFYRLKEAFKGLPELEVAPTTSWNPIEVINCFRVKLWDPEMDRMITLKELRTLQKSEKVAAPTTTRLKSA